RAPEKNAAKFLLGMRGRVQIGPYAFARLILEGAAAGVEVERLGIGIIVVLLPEREGAIDSPVGPHVAIGIAKAPAFSLPRRRHASPDLRPPVLAGREFILPFLALGQREHIIGTRLLVVAIVAAPAKDDEALGDGIIPQRHVPAPADDGRLVELGPGIG